MRNFYLRRFITAAAVAAGTIGALNSLAAPFKPGNIVVARVGNGSAALTTAAAPVFLDEYTPSGMLVQSIALPTSVSGSNRILTASGTAASELSMTRSADGHYLVLTGYSAVPGTTSVSTSQTTNVARIIGLIAADGSIDTSTSTGDAFNRSSIRAAATVDGTSFYSVGGNSGVRYQAFGSYASTQLNTTPTNIRTINVASGNLYISSAAASYYGVSQVGAGLPTAAGQATTVLAGFPNTAASSSPNGFYFADLSADVPGVDVVYVADDGSTGGIQKWSLVNNTWTLNGTITGGATVTVQGLNGATTGATVSLVATSTTGLYVLSDNAGYNAAPSSTTLPDAVATAGTSTEFRGLAFAPVAPAPAIASFTPASGPIGTTVTVTGTNFTNASAITLNGATITGFTVASATTLSFVVPTGATSGAIAVTTPSGTATSTSTFTVTAPSPAPVITSLAPASAVAGSSDFVLTVNGTGFSSSSVVSFNGTDLTTTLVSATQLTAIVPANTVATAGSYPVVVTNSAVDGGASAAVNFTVTAPAPTIVSFTPTSGGPGATVTITGTNFTGATSVGIGSLIVTDFTVVSATTITLTVPASNNTSGLTGTLTVVTPGGTATSTLPFNLVLATLAGQAMPGLAIYPNPATDYVQIKLPQASAATVALRDLTGRLVLAPVTLVTGQPLRLPTSLPTGIYWLEVQQGSEKAVRRIEKN